MKSVGKAAAALRGKAGVLRARVLFLASMRRRAAVVAGISRHIRALAMSQRCQEKKAASGRAVVLSRPADRADVGDEERAATTPAVVVGMAELASLFGKVDEDGDGGCYPDWTLTLHSLFGDEESRGCGGDKEQHRAGDDLGVVDGLDDDDGDEPSVIDLIRSCREGDGQEFRIEDEIDQAADMFITRVRHRMGAQPELA